MVSNRVAWKAQLFEINNPSNIFPHFQAYFSYNSAKFKEFTDTMLLIEIMLKIKRNIKSNVVSLKVHSPIFQNLVFYFI